ncbi:MAG: cytochrome c biogenesis CcdA family protein [Chloroflexota bacterium]
MIVNLTPLGIGGAFLAGLASFLSPCVFPLVPGYLSYLAGTAGAQARLAEDPHELRRHVALHALFFVLGFSLIFVALGATASSLGDYLRSHQQIVQRIAGITLIVAGFQVGGVLRIVPLLRERRLYVERGDPAVLKSALIGMAFGAGWTPCVGPFLGSILTLAAGSASLREGVALLLVYSFGLGVPFLITGLLIDRATPTFRRISPFLPIINLISGVALVITGLLVLSGTLVTLARYAPFLGG